MSKIIYSEKMAIYNSSTLQNIYITKVAILDISESVSSHNPEIIFYLLRMQTPLLELLKIQN